MLAQSLVKRHVCWFSTTLSNMHDVKDVGYDELVVVFNQTCLLVHWKSKRKATWPMPLHQTCQLTMWNFISQDCYIVKPTYMPCRELLYHCSCNIYACWPFVTVTNTAAVQTCLLVECCCKMDACWTMATQTSMPADLLSLNIACLLAVCFSICYTCWYGVSLSAVPTGMVSHYQPCLLAWCFSIGHAFWFGTSLSAIPVGVVPHYRPCLLGWCLTICQVFWCGASL